MRVFVQGIGLLGPGLPGWQQSAPILRGDIPYSPGDLALPPLALLSPTERRRTSLSIRLAIAAALDATKAAEVEVAGLPAVFATSNGDGDVIGALLTVLAGNEPLVSPTQFHNSVHNAAAAYWSIGTRSMAASTSLGCHDDTFAAALLSAASQVTTEGRPVLLCAYDAPMPPPLDRVRATAFPLALAFVLAAEPGAPAKAALDLRFVAAPPGQMPASRAELPALAALPKGNPTARALPLLQILARGEAGRLALAYLENARLDIEVSPCSIKRRSVA